MELDALRVRNYRCIEDSGWVAVDNLLCLVGKNESGKTAFMRAVERLNPSFKTSEYDPYRDYPRDRWPEYSDRHEEDPDIVASARLTLDEADHEAIEEAVASDIVTEETVVVHRDYQEEMHWEMTLDEGICLEYLLDAHDFEDDVESALDDADSLDDLDEEEGALAAVTDELGDEPTAAVANEIGSTALDSRLPAFRHMGEYAIMEGTIEIEELLERTESEELTPGDQVFLSLLSVAGLELEEFEAVDDWRQKASELEAATADVSETAMDYWSQSGDLRIRLEDTTTTDDEGTKQKALEIRVENREHNISVEFEQRSRGFRWFFSSFCQLSELQQREADMVLMLDEPGLNLHARAKQQFLEFMRTELAPYNPIIYTTHSPFMIDAENLHRTKLVMSDPIGEENLFSDVSLANDHTRFPLRNVFELDLMDTLLVNPHTLLVESKADHALLYVVSNLLRDRGQDGLDTRWTVVPIKEYRNIATFLSLFGEDRLDVAALLREDPAAGRRPGRRREDDTVLDDIPITLVSEFASTRGDSTVEDMFSESFYLDLVSQTYASELDEAAGVPERVDVEVLADIDPEKPMVERLQAYFETQDINDGEFERAEPALFLQENRDEFAEELDQDSRRNFNSLFRDLNNTLTSFDGVEPRRGSFLDSLFG